MVASPSDFTVDRAHSNERISARNETQATGFSCLPFRNTSSLDYKNMKMMSVRRFNQMLNSPERDSKLKAVNNSYLSPQYKMHDFMRRDSQ